MSKIDAQRVPELATQLAALPRRSQLSSYEMVRRLLPDIASALERGHTIDDLAALFTKRGTRIAPSTLRNHLWRARREAQSLQDPQSTPTTSQPLDRSHKTSVPTAASASAAKPAVPPEVKPDGRKEVGAAVPHSGHFALRPDTDEI